MDLDTFATALLAQYNRYGDASRPIDRKIENAVLKGMCRGANRLGLGMTETQVEICLLDAYRSAYDSAPRPGFNAGNNAAQKEWDAQVAAFLSNVLATI